MRIFEIVNFRCENVEKYDFGISDEKLLTRPYVFDANFRILHFSVFWLRNSVFLGAFNLENAHFLSLRNLEIETCRAERMRFQDFQPKNR